MSKCKNSSTGTYKGTEPSPKGLGYCARGEKLGKKKKGLDGNMWEVKETNKGIARWVKISKKSTKKPVKKSTKKPVKKSTKKPVKKSAKKSTKKSTKSVKKPVKKISKRPIGNLTVTDIIVHKNNKVFKNNKLTISNNNLVYLQMFKINKNTTGSRLYFGLANLKGNKKEEIKNLKLNIKKKTFEFTYNGIWEDESTGELKMIKVNDTWKIVFKNNLDFDKMERFVKQFKIVKIIE